MLEDEAYGAARGVALPCLSLRTHLTRVEVFCISISPSAAQVSLASAAPSAAPAAWHTGFAYTSSMSRCAATLYSTPNPRPSTLNPQPQTPNQQRYTPFCADFGPVKLSVTTQPQRLKPQTPNPKPQTPNPQHNPQAHRVKKL